MTLINLQETTREELKRRGARARTNRWRAAHRELVNARARESMRRERIVNPERVRNRKRAWAAKNAEAIRKADRRWRAANRDNLNRRAKTWRDANKHRTQAYNLRRYGLSVEAYGLMLAKQDSGCAICGVKRPGGKRGRFFVDHDHSTGKVRGLLCYGCNSAIGYSRDSASLLLKAANYLEKEP